MKKAYRRQLNSNFEFLLSFRMTIKKWIYLVTKSLNAWRAIGQDVGRFNGETCFVDAHATTSFARILNDVAHATLQPLRLTIRNAFAIATLATLLTRRTIDHWR